MNFEIIAVVNFAGGARGERDESEMFNRHLYVDGGVTIQQFLESKLIDEITITRIPILLGSGIPLFGSTGNEQPLRLIEATPSENGFVQERYEVRPAV